MSRQVACLWPYIPLSLIAHHFFFSLVLLRLLGQYAVPSYIMRLISMAFHCVTHINTHMNTTFIQLDISCCIGPWPWHSWWTSWLMVTLTAWFSVRLITFALQIFPYLKSLFSSFFFVFVFIWGCYTLLYSEKRKTSMDRGDEMKKKILVGCTWEWMLKKNMSEWQPVMLGKIGVRKSWHQDNSFLLLWCGRGEKVNQIVDSSIVEISK